MVELTKREISNIQLAMGLAESASKLSKCVRSKVGGVIISQSEGFYVGVNGMLPDEPNGCEIELDDGTLQTKEDVIHAEANALDKMHKEGVSANNCISVQTLSPCVGCTTRMRNIGIKLIVYKELYRCSEHLESKDYIMSYNEFLEKYVK